MHDHLQNSEFWIKHAAPCPRCGGKPRLVLSPCNPWGDIEYPDPGIDGWQVVCDDCGLDGPVTTAGPIGDPDDDAFLFDPRTAVAVWNTRIGDPTDTDECPFCGIPFKTTTVTDWETATCDDVPVTLCPVCGCQP